MFTKNFNTDTNINTKNYIILVQRYNTNTNTCTKRHITNIGIKQRQQRCFRFRH